MAKKLCTQQICCNPQKTTTNFNIESLPNEILQNICRYFLFIRFLSMKFNLTRTHLFFLINNLLLQTATAHKMPAVLTMINTDNY